MRKVALVHDWFTTYAGSERVVGELLNLYPDADVFALVDFLPDEQRVFLKGKPVQTTFLQRAPFARRKYRSYLGLMPLAIESLDLSAYDLVISSSHAVAKGVLTGPDQLHISYIHSPMRYAWDMQTAYLSSERLTSGLRPRLALALLHYIRLWDFRTANGVDVLVANSNYVARRILKVYRRPATVIYPPVDIGRFAFCEQKEDYYLVVSRLVQYKRVDILVRAFQSLPDRRLVIIGDGPEMKRLKRVAGPNVQFLGYQPEATVVEYMQHARAFLFAAQEDFGIALVEAQACGTPVIAYGRGGAVETVRCQAALPSTGCLFGEQTSEAVVEAIGEFEQEDNQVVPRECRQNALRFSPDRFRDGFTDLVERSWAQMMGDNTG